MWQQPQYDEHQFAGRKARAVSAETGIAFSDYERMRVKRVKVKQERRLPTPEWANSDEGLRRAVLRFCERYVHISKPSGTDSERLQAIRDKAKANLPNVEARLGIALKQYYELNGQQPEGKRDFAITIQNLDRQVQILRRGLPELVTAATTYYYRLGWNSVQIAEEFNLTSPLIREWFYRMNRRESGQKCPRWNGPRKAITPWPKEMLHKLFVMQAEGKSFKECASHFGITSAAIPCRLQEAKKACARAGKWDAGRLQLFRELRGAGLSFNQCAKRLGTDVSYAIKVWRKNFGDLNSSKRRVD